MYCTALFLFVILSAVAVFLYLANSDILVPPPPPAPRRVETFRSTDLPIGGGASPELDKPRNPYTLLDGLQPRLLGERPLAYVNAEGCYARDYAAAHSLTGNYSKMTNNMMPTYPDNCTGPRQEFTAAFYTLNRA